MDSKRLSTEIWSCLDQMFAAILKLMTFRVLFVVVAFFNLDIDQIDIKTAFLYRLIDQLVYVDIPKGSKIEANRKMIGKHFKALYNFKQFPRLWYERLSNFLLQKLGFARINVNHSIFITFAGLDGPVVSIFVNDIKIMAPKGSNIIAKVKSKRATAFSIVNMGRISFYLGLKIEYDRAKQTIKLLQPAYIDKLLSRFYLDKARIVTTPMKESTTLEIRTNG